MGREEAIAAWKRRWGLPDGRGRSLDDSFIITRRTPLTDAAPKPFRDDTAIDGRTLEFKAMSTVALQARMREDRAELDTTTGARHTELAQDLRVAARVLREKDDATIAAYEFKPSDSALFGKGMDDRRRDKARMNLLTMDDQIGRQAYSEHRREELTEVLGDDHYLVKAYGLRSAKSSRTDGLRIENEYSASYMRGEATEKAAELLDTVYEKATGEEPDRSKVFYVNSPRAMHRVASFFPGLFDHVDHEYTCADEATDLGNGLYAVEFDKALADPFDSYIRGVIHTTGCTPSTYDAERAAFTPEDADPTLTDEDLLAEEDLGNGEKLKDVCTGATVKAFRDVPEHHPMKAVAGATEKMLVGLQSALAATIEVNGEAFGKNKLIKAALDNIEQIAALMPSQLGDMARYTKLYDVLIDEIYLLLATCKPYDDATFKTAAKDALLERAPVLAEDPVCPAPQVYGASSGMGALSTAIMCATMAEGDSPIHVDLVDKGEEHKGTAKGERSANYFETEAGLLQMPGAVTPTKGPVVVATLNPSTPTTKLDEGLEPPADAEASKAWDADALITHLRGKYDGLKGSTPEELPGTGPRPPMTAIIDVTVEKGAEDPAERGLNKIFTAFKAETNAGNIVFVLCKSYQKYPSMGAGKMMSGSLTVVGCDAEGADASFMDKLTGALKTEDEALDFMAKDESQLMAHMIKHGSDMELPLIKRAADNAAELGGVLKDIRKRTGLAELGFAQDPHYSKDLPFLLVGGDDLKVTIGGDAREIAPEDLLAKVGVEERSSFGFHAASCLPITEGQGTDDETNYVRINPGQESTGETLEKLFAVSLLSSAQEDVDAKFTMKVCNALIETAFEKVKDYYCSDLPETDSDDGWEEFTRKRLMMEAAARASGLLNEANEDELTKIESDDKEARREEELARFDELFDLEMEDETATAITSFLMINSLVEHTIPDGPGPDPRLGEDMNVLMASPVTRFRGDPDGEPPVDLIHMNAMLGSMLRFAGAVFDSPEDQEKTAPLIDAVIDSGMKGLSPGTKNQLLLDRGSRIARGTGPVAERAAAVSKLAVSLPRPETAVALLADPDLNDAVIETGMETLSAPIKTHILSDKAKRIVLGPETLKNRAKIVAETTALMPDPDTSAELFKEHCPATDYSAGDLSMGLDRIGSDLAPDPSDAQDLTNAFLGRVSFETRFKLVEEFGVLRRKMQEEWYFAKGGAKSDWQQKGLDYWKRECTILISVAADVTALGPEAPTDAMAALSRAKSDGVTLKGQDPREWVV